MTTFVFWATIWGWTMDLFYLGWLVPLLMLGCLVLMALLLFGWRMLRGE